MSAEDGTKDEDGAAHGSEDHCPLLQYLWIWSLLNIFSTLFQLLSDADGV